MKRSENLAKYFVVVAILAFTLGLSSCKKKALQENTQNSDSSSQHYNNHSGSTASGAQNSENPLLKPEGVQREIASISGSSDESKDSATNPAKGALTHDTSIPKAPEVLEPNCFTQTFVHKNKDHSEENCSQHRNLIKIKHKEYQKDSVCIRVDGKPVRFKFDLKEKDSLMVGPVAGPGSKITVRYCLNKTPTCKENCKIPKDEFLSALGGDDDEGEVDAKDKKIAHYGQWDESNPNEKPTDITGKLDASLRKELKDAEEFAADIKLYKDWEMNQEASSCVGKVGENSNLTAQKTESKKGL